eukprot:CAMPEP_0170547228 /NCGR_PEP_ID=MMETSP0211-20121228/5593_1 /TAXON_ID=311385 /ORGANISM="Pseudokeronopsis sp., Strain OXSARD2" /LENGTH=58 /DNA_ID=CAMNT_0010852119 /DNA_START=230 /DNA_END=406 /DNA_ORIENTATION=-
MIKLVPSPKSTYSKAKLVTESFDQSSNKKPQSQMSNSFYRPNSSYFLYGGGGKKSDTY